MTNENRAVDIELVNELNLLGSVRIKFDYEKGHMYRGVRFIRGQQSRYRKTRNEDKRSPYAEGHNGHMIGDWWPERICAMRDRAHGDLRRGICGKAGVGAVSIILGKSSKEDYKDIDNGDEIEYCGDGRELMDLSHEKGMLIRVLRGAGVDSKWAPAVGIRYDGLYKIVDKEDLPEKNFARYKLVRDGNQKPFPTGTDSRPTIDEIDEVNEMKAQYGKK
ncbi:hypothetical protein NHQ30_003261 [Ciborinia camelliae]|nr:hypothetical protein NHQ30_003261 [Ciborinia camelliae]